MTDKIPAITQVDNHVASSAQAGLRGIVISISSNVTTTAENGRMDSSMSVAHIELTWQDIGTQLIGHVKRDWDMQAALLGALKERIADDPELGMMLKILTSAHKNEHNNEDENHGT